MAGLGMRRTKIPPVPCVGQLSVTLPVYRWVILMKTVSRINTAWLITVTYRTEWEPRFDTEIIDFATWYVMNTGVLCASLTSRVIAGARLLSLVPSCSLLRKINDSFVQFSEIRVRQAYSHLRYLKLYRNRTCEVSCNRFSHLFRVGSTLNNRWSL